MSTSLDGPDALIDSPPPASRLQKFLKAIQLILGGVYFVIFIGILFVAVAIRVIAVGLICALAFEAGYHHSFKPVGEIASVGKTAAIACVLGGTFLGDAVGLLVAAGLTVNHLLRPDRPQHFLILQAFQDRKSMNVAVGSFILSFGRVRRIRSLVLLGSLAGIASVCVGLAIYPLDDIEDDSTNGRIRAVVLSLVGTAILGCATWFSKEKQEEGAIRLGDEEP